VFYAGSSRALSVQQAEQVVADLPPFVTLVGLFVDAEPAEVREACERLPLNLLQFHGDETNDYCGQFGLPWIKALRVGGGTDIDEAVAGYPGASGILLDTWRAGAPGGTGESFDWALVPAILPRPLVLAGGLRADNVAAAISAVQPFAVDVSGGVEASPGIKDAGKIREFVAAVEAADRLSEAGK
jgi:phosphoribosylanthranilate isomerase